jgi:hypothetical protein
MERRDAQSLILLSFNVWPGAKSIHEGVPLLTTGGGHFIYWSGRDWIRQNQSLAGTRVPAQAAGELQ